MSRASLAGSRAWLHVPMGALGFCSTDNLLAEHGCVRQGTKGNIATCCFCCVSHCCFTCSITVQRHAALCLDTIRSDLLLNIRIPEQLGCILCRLGNLLAMVESGDGMLDHLDKLQLCSSFAEFVQALGITLLLELPDGDMEGLRAACMQFVAEALT